MTQLPENRSLSWTEDMVPVSAMFDDVYYSKDDGLAESHYVFVQGLGEEIWQQSDIQIAETGFGTGLNLLATLQHLDRVNVAAHLTYYSVEAYPLTKEELIKAHGVWSELAPYSQMLANALPETPLGEGWHIFDLAPNRRLVLLIGDVVTQYQSVSGTMDGWYLDGFAPSKNPDMWRIEVFEQLSRLSHEGTKLTTFTAAGFVRRGLIDVGFDMEKRPGFGRKRDCLIGTRRSLEVPPKTSQKSWSMLPKSAEVTGAVDHEEIVILGAGIGGASVSYHLRQLGKDPLILEQAEAPAQGASGNPIGMVMPRHIVGDMPERDLYETAFAYTASFLEGLEVEKKSQSCTLASSQEEADRFKKVAQHPRSAELGLRYVSGAQLLTELGQQHAFGAMICDRAVSVRPPDFVEALLSGGRVRYRQRVDRYERSDQGLWLLYDAQDNLLCQTKHLICAAGAGIAALGLETYAPLDVIKGQVSAFKTDQDPSAAFVKGHYITHNLQNEICFGATFDHLEEAEKADFLAQHMPQFAVSAEDHQRNISGIEGIFPLEDLSEGHLVGRASARLATTDHIPVVGPMVDRNKFIELYAGLRKGARFKSEALDGQTCPNLWVTGCFGARGLVIAPYLGLYLAYLVAGKRPIISIRQIEALHPARFLARDLIRGKL